MFLIKKCVLTSSTNTHSVAVTFCFTQRNIEVECIGALLMVTPGRNFKSVRVGYFLESDFTRFCYRSTPIFGDASTVTFVRLLKDTWSFPLIHAFFYIRNDKMASSTRSFLIFTPFLVPKIS